MFFPALQGQTPPWFHRKKPATFLLQVDELKAKLATQEVELRQKNEDADKLIQVVGVESDKVSREKAIADEEERKVALIMLEVQQKQKDCEEDLAKAEPALTAAQAALNTLNKVGGTCVCWLIPLGRSSLSSDPKAAHHAGVPRDTRARSRGLGWDQLPLAYSLSRQTFTYAEYMSGCTGCQRNPRGVSPELIGTGGANCPASSLH